MKGTAVGFLAVVMMLATSGCMTTQSSNINLPRRPTQTELREAAELALQDLYKTMPFSKTLLPKVKAILVFPWIYKAGFMVGGQTGDGVALSSTGKVYNYYNISAASYGLQIGAQGYSYALFIMTDEAIQYMKDTGGLEVGVGPSVVLVDEGIAKTLSTTTAQDGVYAFIFNQKGLMAGLGIQGSKITRINPAP